MPNNNLSRRKFITQAAAALVSVNAIPLSACNKEDNPVNSDNNVPLAIKPGRIIINRNSSATSGTTVNESIVQKMIDDCIMQLTGIKTDPVAAFESLFPNLNTSTKIALKPNFLNSIVPTRKEVAKAVINRLTQMLNGTFPASNIFLYERHSFSGVGYTTSYFGKNVKMVVDSSFPDNGYYIYCDGRNRPYSQTLHDCDYLINMPVLKDHSSSVGGLTLSFKNHLGTVNPGGSLGICGNIQAIMDIMASSVIKSKQALIILDAIFGVYDGGPGGNQQCAPNTIFMSQDPVTIDYYGREMINSYRTQNHMSAKKGEYIEKTAVAPYNCGIADPAKMEIIRVENGIVTFIKHHETIPGQSWDLYQNYPNPFNTQTDITFELQKEANVNISIYDIQGRKVCELINSFQPPQLHILRWNADNMSSGIYFCKMTVEGVTQTKIMNLLK